MFKNSVRHNLSLYDIFVREKSPPDQKPTLSWWTIRPDYKTRRSRIKPVKDQLPLSSHEDDDVSSSILEGKNGLRFSREQQ